MSYRIDLGQWNGVFAVPVSLVDNHIKLASESQLKVLLYMLRHSDKAVTAAQLSSELRISEEEAANAVAFWIERELLCERGGELIPSEKPSGSIAEKPAAKKEEPGKEQKKSRTIPSRAHRPDPEYVTKRLEEDKNLHGLMEYAEQKFQKPLSQWDLATLVMLHDTYGLPCELLAMLITYLSESGDGDMRSLEKQALRMADEGIKTRDAAAVELDRMKQSGEAWSKVSKIMGIHNVGKPTKAQMEYAYRWLYTWGFSDEMILEAYERCVNTKGEYNIRYINAILQKWYEAGIKSIDSLNEAEASRKKPQKKKKSSAKGSVFSVEGASFDVSKYEEDSLFDD